MCVFVCVCVCVCVPQSAIISHSQHVRAPTLCPSITCYKILLEIKQAKNSHIVGLPGKSGVPLNGLGLALLGEAVKKICINLLGVRGVGAEC